MHAGLQDSDPAFKQPLLHESQQQSTPQRQNEPYPSQHPASDQYATTRLNTLASYGQLVAPQSLQDAPQTSHPEIQPQQGAESSEAGPSSSASFSQGIARRQQPNITITDPIKHSEKSMMPGVSGSFVTYAVTSRMALPKYSSRGASVRRRFRDFVVSDLLTSVESAQIAPGLTPRV